MTEILLIAILVAALLGWWLLTRPKKQYQQKKSQTKTISPEYFVGLNYLLSEQPDKAVDIFIKLLEVDSDTVETHLALGSLFRRRGEVDRAIRIHQNVIARPNLTASHRAQVLLALGQDYMLAGVLDRAEKVFLEVAKHPEQRSESLHYLLDIYQQEKNWQKAIEVAEYLDSAVYKNIPQITAHYYCELAYQASTNGQKDTALRYLKRAQSIDKQCVRASLLQGEIECDNGRYKQAIRYFQQVQQQDPDYLSETLSHLFQCYEKLGREAELYDYLQKCLSENPRISFALMIAERLKKIHSQQKAVDFMVTYLQENPSIRGLDYLIGLQLQIANYSEKTNLETLHELITSLLKDKPVYRCHMCGFSGKTLHWRCPSCNEWGTVKPIHGLEGD